MIYPLLFSHQKYLDITSESMHARFTHRSPSIEWSIDVGRESQIELALVQEIIVEHSGIFVYWVIPEAVI